MSGLAPSNSNSGGVASLRARFEGNSKSRSPPSRSRSPVGSVSSDSSRPLSKVRTNFTAVEPLGSRESERPGQGQGQGQGTMTDGTQDLKEVKKEAARDEHDEAGASMNGKAGATAPVSLPDAKSPSSQETTPTVKDIAVNPDKPTSTAEDPTAALLPADPKQAVLSSGDDTLGKEGSGLGSILKGSPFEKEQKGESKKETGSQKPSTSSRPPAIAKPPGAVKTPSSSLKAMNGKPKESAAVVPRATPPTSKHDSATLTSQSKEIAKESTKSLPEPSKKESEHEETSGKTDSVPNIEVLLQGSAEGTNGTKTPTAPTLDTEKFLPKTTVPDQTPSGTAKRTATETRAGTKPIGTKAVADASSSKPSSKEIPSASTRTSKTLSKKLGSTSPPTSSKPRPKSPTRPVRLSSHLTAPTAASAAKFDHNASTQPQQPARPPSRTHHVPNNKPVSSKPSSTLEQRTSRPPRASMPAAGIPSSRPIDKPKVRQSLAGGGTQPKDRGSFLERMTQPTQSSARKTHDKLDAGGKHSPPSKKPAASGSRNVSLNLENKKKHHLPVRKPKTATDSSSVEDHGNQSKVNGNAEAETPEDLPKQQPDLLSAGESQENKLGIESKDVTPNDNKVTLETVAATSTIPQSSAAEPSATIPSSSDIPSPTRKPLVPQPITNAGETF